MLENAQCPLRCMCDWRCSNTWLLSVVRGSGSALSKTKLKLKLKLFGQEKAVERPHQPPVGTVLLRLTWPVCGQGYCSNCLSGTALVAGSADVQSPVRPACLRLLSHINGIYTAASAGLGSLCTCFVVLEAC